jgi:hypothetical protein
LPFPQNIDEWATVLQAKQPPLALSEKNTGQNFYVLLELVKRGAAKGYVLIAIPVLVDSPCFDDTNELFFSPNTQAPISLNGEYFLGEHNEIEPEIKLNHNGIAQQSLNKSFITGTAQSWFSCAKDFLYSSCSVKSLSELLERVCSQLNDQEVTPQLSLVSKPDSGANYSLIKLYEGIASDGPSVYQGTPLERLLAVYNGQDASRSLNTKEICSAYCKPTKKTYSIDEPYLLGHMDEQSSTSDNPNLNDNRALFPLDNTQRDSSIAVASLDKVFNKHPTHGRVLAVNGPPGSGKTSMLKAVVAHNVVKAALLKEPCPIIVASGATNQSVKNVTSAFPAVIHADNDKHLLCYQRWLPGCQTYGSYFASDNAKSQLSEIEKQSIPILVSGGIDKPYNFGWEDVSANLSDINLNEIHRQYYLTKSSQYFLSKGVASPTTVEQVINALHDDLTATYNKMVNAVQEAKKQLFKDNADLDKVFPIIQKKNHLSTFVALRKELIKLYEEDTVAIYEKVCRERIKDECIEAKDYKSALRNTALDVIIEQCVDLEYRPLMFHLASRYWEGQFLVDQVKALHFSVTEDNLLASLRRVCMITPVIICTTNKMPGLLKIKSYPPGAKQRGYAYGGIDLLITDESGQATLMGSLPLASLTKRMVSVGDVLQLAPVINEKESVSAFDEHLIWMKNGFATAHVTDIFARQLAVTNGSLLHLVQKASTLNYQGDGFMLRGHYRCYENIIDYCNKLVYDNKLLYLPQLKNDMYKKGLPSMAYVETSGASIKGSGNKSKQNATEAKMIARLVLTKYRDWQEKLSDKDKPKPLNELVAIITPFNQQPAVILAELYKANEAHNLLIPKHEIKSTTIDTIHSLQGAERDIIIYSGVQTNSDSDKLFFAKQPYLLNVAISRAKKSFIAFICPELYNMHDQVFINKAECTSNNSAHFLGWYLANFAKRLYPNNLFIIEAKGKIEALSSILGDDYIINATHGAVTNLSLVDGTVDAAIGQMRPCYTLLKNGQATLDTILSEGPKLDNIYLATDDDNVGELIAWHLQHGIAKQQPELLKKVHRIALRSITQQGVNEALASPRNIDHQRVSSEIARDIIDKWLAQSMRTMLANKKSDKSKKTPGMGRVKAMILDLVARHEAEKNKQYRSDLSVTLTVNKRVFKGVIKNVPQKYHQLITDKVNASSEPLTTTPERCKLLKIKSNEVSASYFNRSTLEIMALAWRRHKMLPKTTTNILQKLYEAKK